MSYEGPSLANQNNRKLGVFDRKLELTIPDFQMILKNIREKEAIMVDE